MHRGENMGFATWRDEYAIGVPEIDAQHRALFAAVEDLHTAFMHNQDGLKVAQIIDFMDGYARSHFRTEEALLESAEMPDLEGHIQNHRVFFEQVEDYLGRTQSNTRLLSMEVLHFLRDWLIAHVTETDRDVAKYLKPQS